MTLTEKDKFCEYIREHENAMYALALSILNNQADAGEAVSESVFRAYKNLDTLKNKKSFKPWILRIVHNTAVEMIRKNERMIPMDEIPVTTDNSSQDLTAKLALRDAVAGLKQPYRTLVVLFYYEDFSTARIAQITNTNIVTVRKQLSRARKMLREILKEDFNHE
jgi:RNA polymerase sigma-70 factor (ECF subfamily)